MKRRKRRKMSEGKMYEKERRRKSREKIKWTGAEETTGQERERAGIEGQGGARERTWKKGVK